MLQLTYISTARSDVAIKDVEQILAVSRRRNAIDRITGLLLFDGKRFLQALEGEANSVESAFVRIKQDLRHRAIVRLSERNVAEREFGEWAMASHLVGSGFAQATLPETVDALVAQVPDANTRELFRSFARIDRRAA